MPHALDREFDGVKLGDRRLETRARATIEALSARPDRGVPQVLTAAELEGYYRFVNNEKVTFERLLAAHRTATLERAGAHQRVIIAHDTTECRFSDECEREGLGPMPMGGQGFYAHFSLAVTNERRPLGVVAVKTWTRSSRVSAKLPQRQRYKDPAKESLRWIEAARTTNELFDVDTRVIHVMDREADDYDMLNDLVAGDYGFVIRASYDRRLAEASPDTGLKAFARELPVRYQREAELANRVRAAGAKERKRYPARKTRTTTLNVAAGPVTLRRPNKSNAQSAELTLNLVHVLEATPPPGEAAVEWFLLTGEPIDTEEQVLRAIDDYRARWVVEEFFKALKTGCAYEKRQHETKHALLNALGIYIPIAWSLLNLRTQSRDELLSTRPATELFTETQLTILNMESKGRVTTTSTVRDAVLLMARLMGGLQPSNGGPGWQVLGRAYEKLLCVEVGWRLAVESFEKTRPRYDR